jgi:hypothetical protein
MNQRRPGVIAKVIATDAAAGAVPIGWDETSRLFAAERWYGWRTLHPIPLRHISPAL